MSLRDRDLVRTQRAVDKAKLLGLDSGLIKNKLTTAESLVRNLSDGKRSSKDSMISFDNFGKKKIKMSSKGPRREAGLKFHAVGKFKNGMLQLSENEIRRVQNSSLKKGKGKSKGKLPGKF
jgi:hypothetical protein